MPLRTVDCARAFKTGVVLVLIAGAAVGRLPSVNAAPNDFPDHPLTLIVPAPPGGGTDITGRLFASVAQKYVGQPIEIVNVGGANNAVGTAKAAAARPDGYTVLIASSDSITIEPNRSRLPYSYKSFVPLAEIDKVTYILAAGPRSPIRTAAALKSFGRLYPNRLTVGVSGIGGSPHLAIAGVLQALGGLQVRYIPFEGSGQAMAAALGGTVDLMIGSIATVLTAWRAGKLYPLFVTAPDPVAPMPDIPGAKALGVPGASMVGWRIIFAPVRTPSDVVGKLNAAFEKALADPDYTARLLASGGEGASNTNVADLQKMLANENGSMVSVLRAVFGTQK